MAYKFLYWKEWEKNRERTRVREKQRERERPTYEKAMNINYVLYINFSPLQLNWLSSYQSGEFPAAWRNTVCCKMHWTGYYVCDRQHWFRECRIYLHNVNEICFAFVIKFARWHSCCKAEFFSLSLVLLLQSEIDFRYSLCHLVKMTGVMADVNKKEKEKSGGKLS